MTALPVEIITPAPALKLVLEEIHNIPGSSLLHAILSHLGDLILGKLDFIKVLHFLRWLSVFGASDKTHQLS